ncbi:helix-turn-helix domain-containing protein [Marinibactrum halimedae]|nr:AraC family transcriptional regulator [Marinibactrum halimedae]MCD9460091.1 AraC family transcriptional regulator [Marinibactrum halimedae]
MFNCDTGFIGQRIGGVIRIIASQSNLDSIYDGQLLQVTEPMVASVLGGNVASINPAMGGSAFSSPDLAYNGDDIHGLIARAIEVYDETFGVMCFFSTQRDKEYVSEDTESIELMAKGVAKMIELQSSYKDQRAQTTGFATPGVKHFDDYLLQARLPEAYGVAGRVIEVLKQRIGKSALGIGDIAAELNLSKRTLQRRLQQQDVSFAELRDKVRFHYSIDYLIEHNSSIDSISNALDFSDRTSFTNAFKRWTGLSPSTFRKLFRDYA